MCIRDRDNIGAYQRWFGFQPNTKAATLIFGFFHGFGLSTKILEYDISPDGLIPNLLAFNVGVEIGQLIALAMICKLKGLEFTAVVDPKISPANLKMLRLYGANVVSVTQKDENDGYLLTRINTVKQLLHSIPNSVWINQYANPDNWRSHYYGEAREILGQINHQIDYLVIGASTSGTCLLYTSDAADE